MYRRLSVLAASIAFLAGSLSYESGVALADSRLAAQGAVGREGPPETETLSWNLSKDLAKPDNQISFNQGANGVWYFLESDSFSHDVFTYRFLTDYPALCPLDPLPGLIGLACWMNPNADPTGNKLPLVGFNFTDTTLFPIPPVLGIPPRSLWMHPSSEKLAIVGWRSPIHGNVEIAGSFSDLASNCGNGVLWFIDKGRNTLRSGNLPNGGVESFGFSAFVKKDQVLYFVVDPKQGDNCADSTGLDATITTK